MKLESGTVHFDSNFHHFVALIPNHYILLQFHFYSSRITSFAQLQTMLSSSCICPIADTYINVEDFFPDSPEFVKLLRLIENPDVLEVMLTSFNTPKVSDLERLSIKTPISSMSRYSEGGRRSSILLCLRVRLCWG